MKKRNNILILFCGFVLLCSYNANAQRIKDKQIYGSTPKSTLFVMGTDTVSASTTYGQGKWFVPTDTAYAVGTDTIVIITLDGDTLIFDTGDVPDADWYEQGLTLPPDAITDSMFHTGRTAIGADGPYRAALTIVDDIGSTDEPLEINAGLDQPYIKMRANESPEYSWVLYISDDNTFFLQNIDNGDPPTDPFIIGPSAPSNSITIASSGDLLFGSYPSSRDDGSPTNVLGTDGSGNLKSYPVADVTGAGSSDHDWYEQGTTTPPNNIDDNMFTGTGNHGIGTTTPAVPLHVVGVTRITGSGSTATTITGRDTNHDITDVGTGWGIDLTSGNLVVDSSQVATQYDLTLAVAGGMSNWLLAASGTGGTESITNGETVTLTAGTGISVTRSTNNVTISNTGDSDNSATNEIQDITITGASQPFTVDLSGDATDETITGAGIVTITRSGNAVTWTGTEVDGSTTNELNTIEENNVSVQTGNSDIDFQTMFDVATDGAGEVNVSLDLGEATTVTTPEADDYLIMYDAGLTQGQKILYSDVASLIGDGNGIYDGSGTVPSTTAVTLTNTLNFDSGTLYVDGTNNRVGVGTTSPDNTFNVEASAQIEGKIRDLADACDFYLEGTVNSAASTASFRFDNKDTDIDKSGDWYQVANLTPTKRSATAPGGYLNFNIGYDTLLLDNVLRVASRETGATSGYVKVNGGLRLSWVDDATSSYTLNTGNYGLRMTAAGAKTVTLPAITTGGLEPDRGQQFEIFNDSSSGDITVSAAGGNTIVGTTTIGINQFITIRAAGTTKWISD